VAAGPVITGRSPTSGAVGSEVTITGTGFGTLRGTSTVSFGATAVSTYVSWGATQIRVNVPNGVVGASNITVTVAGVTSNAVVFTVSAGTVIYVTDANGLAHGAHRDGVTDDSDHIEAAFLAAHTAAAGGTNVTVSFPAGTYAVAYAGRWSMPTIRTNDWVGQASPTYQRRGVVTLSGAGATIKYANETGRFCWLQAPNQTYVDSQWDTYGNLVIDGFTIDTNNRQPAQECGAVFWMQSSANMDNVTIRNVTMLDHVPARTTMNPSNTSQGIYIKGNFDSRGQAHASYITRITVEDCVIYGQSKPLGILTDATGGEAVIGTNPMVVDNITLTRSTFDSRHFYGSNAHIGGHASSGTTVVTDCTFSNSCDDGLEINAHDSVTISGCTFHQNRQSICHTWFSFPKSAGTPTWLIENCNYSGDCGTYWLTSEAVESETRSPMMPEIRKYATTAEYAPGDTRSWGTFVITGCRLEFGVSNAYVTHRAPFTIGSSGPPLQEVRIIDCDITDVGSGGSLIYVRQGTSLGRTLPVTIQDVRWRSSAGGTAYALLPSSKVSLYNPAQMTITTDIPGL
jgi:hypothetical protein